MFKNMKIWMQFLTGFVIVLALMISIILVSLSQMKANHEKLARIVEVNNVRILLAAKMSAIARDNSISIRDIMISGKDMRKINAMKDSIVARRKVYDENNKLFHLMTPADDLEAQTLMDNADLSMDSSRAENNRILALVEEDRYSEALNILNNQAKSQRIFWIKNLEALIQFNIAKSQMRYQQAQKAATDSRLAIMTLGLLALIISLIIAMVLTRGVTRPIGIATELVTTRDLTMDVSDYMEGKNELFVMIQLFSKDIAEKIKMENELVAYKDSLEQRTADLSNVLIEVKETVNIIASSSSEILAATTQVASGTAETASAISETTSTVEEVQQAAKLSSQKANNVADSAQKVVLVSQNGQKAIDEAVNGMNHIREQMDSIAQTIVRLSEQSQSIGGIIASVTDIAEQSNLLAVNAAIEAAKAGEQGKGFAVVAQEIKNLAAQSKQSTAEVRNILNDVQKATSAAVMATEQGSKAVETGVRQSALAGEAIRALAESSNIAFQAATQIVASSQQQVIGMDQIGVAMQNINQAGTETAVSMLQSEKSAKSLHELGQKLKDLVDKFKM